MDGISIGKAGDHLSYSNHVLSVPRDIYGYRPPFFLRSSELCTKSTRMISGTRQKTLMAIGLTRLRQISHTAHNWVVNGGSMSSDLERLISELAGFAIELENVQEELNDELESISRTWNTIGENLKMSRSSDEASDELEQSMRRIRSADEATANAITEIRELIRNLES